MVTTPDAPTVGVWPMTSPSRFASSGVVGCLGGACGSGVEVTLITAWHARATVRALPRIRMCMNHTIGCSPHRCWCMACQVMPCLTIWSMAGLSSSGLKHRSPFIMTWSPPMDWK